MREERLGDLEQQARAEAANVLGEVASRETEAVKKAREERWQSSADLSTLMRAAYSLYPEATRISRYRGEAYRELGSLRGGTPRDLQEQRRSPKELHKLEALQEGQRDGHGRREGKITNKG